MTSPSGPIPSPTLSQAKSHESRLMLHASESYPNGHAYSRSQSNTSTMTSSEASAPAAMLDTKHEKNIQQLMSAMEDDIDYLSTYRTKLSVTTKAERYKRKLRLRMRLISGSQCVVCGEQASGVYFGALVCLPCKSFYIRCTKGGKNQLTCLGDRKCEINRSNRLRCQYCRYQRCLEAGMVRREKPEAVEPAEGQELCRVCLDIANGIHFGVTTCEGCKKFFRRALKEAQTYICKADSACVINPRNRNLCRYCRYQRCLNVGMSRQAIRMGRPKKTKGSRLRVSPSRKHHYRHGTCSISSWDDSGTDSSVTASPLRSPLPPSPVLMKNEPADVFASTSFGEELDLSPADASSRQLEEYIATMDDQDLTAILAALGQGVSEDIPPQQPDPAAQHVTFHPQDHKCFAPDATAPEVNVNATLKYLPPPYGYQPSVAQESAQFYQSYSFSTACGSYYQTAPDQYSYGSYPLPMTASQWGASYNCRYFSHAPSQALRNHTALV